MATPLLPVVTESDDATGISIISEILEILQ